MFLRHCHVCNFTIIPANGAGLGERSDSVSIGECIYERVYSVYTHHVYFTVETSPPLIIVKPQASCDDVTLTFQENVRL